MSQISYLHELCAQISQIVFLADLTVLRLITTVWAKNVRKLISPRSLCAQVSANRVLSWFDRFTAYYNCMSKNVTKLISPRAKISLTAQVSLKNVFLADLTVLLVLRIKENVTKLQLYELKRLNDNTKCHISPRVVCTNITNRVLSWFDRFTAYYNCMSKNVTKLISPRVLCTSITKRVFSWFDRFTAYYNRISKNVTKLISPRFRFTRITSFVLSWFDRFTADYNCIRPKMSQNPYLREFCA